MEWYSSYCVSLGSRGSRFKPLMLWSFSLVCSWSNLIVGWATFRWQSREIENNVHRGKRGQKQGTNFCCNINENHQINFLSALNNPFFRVDVTIKFSMLIFKNNSLNVLMIFEKILFNVPHSMWLSSLYLFTSKS